MKQNNFKLVIGFFMFLMVFGLQAQQKSAKKTISNEPLQLTEENQRHFDETGFIRCATVEVEALRRQNDPSVQSVEEFENWLAPLIEERKQRIAQQKADGTFRRVIVNIPIIFHVLTDTQGDTNDLSASQIQAQIDQLNIDFGNLAGSTHAAAADAEIVFIPATIDPSGTPLAEPGIDRVYGYAGTLSTAALDNTIKPATIWDRSLYANIWTANLGGGLLGYAQFPTNSTLPGMPASGGSALTDGVVVLAGSVGSVANPGTVAPYNLGRTLTHEIGHWIGLRHIWGDSNCGNDYCADTPESASSNGGCPTLTTCDGIQDMVENYMDYTNDACMDIFTNDQVGRMVTALENATGLSSLPSSNTGDPVEASDLDARIDIAELNVANCSDYSITPELTITNKGNDVLTSATISYNLDGGTDTDINWTGTLELDESESIFLPQINTPIATYTFNVELTSPNGGTDENPGDNVDSANFEITGSACASVGNMDYLTSTTGVIFNTISNLNTGKPSGYSDYTAMSTSLNRDSSYDLTVNANSDGNYQIITYAWIDWNQNCSFDDPGEQYDLGQSADINNLPTANSPLSITVPVGADLGNTTMRITTKYTDPNANQFPTSCEMNHDAEVEDYTINVLAQLGVEENAFESFSMYPNPANNEVTIELSTNQDVNITIFDIRGREVFTNGYANNSTLFNRTISLDAMTTGLYLVQITSGDKKTTKKLIIE